MSTTPSLPSYTEIATALGKSDINASQAHGLMCGLICGTAGEVKVNWQEMLLKGIKNTKAIEVLEELFETSYHQMSEFSFEFTLLLPEDSIHVTQRAEALGLWCQGFLTGLEQSKIPLKNLPPSEMTEALDDLIEISQVNYEDVAADDEDETAYFELVEYVRLAALMIFHELKSGSLSETNENNSLH